MSVAPRHKVPAQNDPVLVKQSLPWLGVAFLGLLAFSLPFELETPSLRVGPLQLTNLELLLAVTLVFALLVVLRQPGVAGSLLAAVPPLWIVLLALHVAALLLSALVAPSHWFNALQAALRILGGLSLVVAVPLLIRRESHLRFLAIALAAGGLLSAVAGMAEILAGDTFEWLNLIRLTPTVAGPYARLSGSFNHANQAAMFIEATLPLLVVLAAMAFRRGRTLAASAGILASLVYLQASFLTYSRASFVTTFLSSMLVAILVWGRRPSRKWLLALPVACVAATVVLLAAANIWSSPLFRLRLSSEGDNEWYRLSFRVPHQIEVPAGQAKPVTLGITNEGALVWSSNRGTQVNLGAWLRPLHSGGGTAKELRWPLSEEVRPGESITMTIPLVAPEQAGQYQLEWDLVQEYVVWFSMKNGSRTTTRLNVSGQTISPLPDSARPSAVGEPPLARPIPDRRTLWRAAYNLLLDRPLTGIGQDNFRLTYGQALGLPGWNDTIHSNNLYIETLVSVGLLGSLPFFAWLALLARDVVHQLRGRRATYWTVALATGLFAFLIHGLLDYFLMFNGTGLLFWLLVGMWLVVRRGSPGTCDQKASGPR